MHTQKGAYARTDNIFVGIATCVRYAPCSRHLKNAPLPLYAKMKIDAHASLRICMRLESVLCMRSSHYCVIISSSSSSGERAVCSVSQRGCMGVALGSCSQGLATFANEAADRCMPTAHTRSMPWIILGSGS